MKIIPVNMRRLFCAGFFLAGVCCLSAQEAPRLKTGGSITTEFTGYTHDFKSAADAEAASLGDIVSGSLEFSASGENAAAFIGLNLSAKAFAELMGRGADPGGAIYTPLVLDEAYLRAFFGAVSVEAGLRKLKWGKADSLGPLDVVNPIDYTSLTAITDLKAMKIARPMLHITWNAGDFSKLEAVFIPNFAGHRFDYQERWKPQALAELSARAQAGLLAGAMQQTFFSTAPNAFFPAVQEKVLAYFSDTSATGGLGFFQTGLRFTTTAGGIDLGAQYFYGNFFRPGVTLNGNGAFTAFINDLIAGNPSASWQYYGDPEKLAAVKYSRYHQIGLDYAQALAGFNLRAELAAHITEDLSGDDGATRNPFIGWSFGFDRDLFWEFNFNVQCNETIRLLNGKVGADPLFDCEAGENSTATRLTMRLSRKFLYDELECTAAAIWDIEDSGCYVIPSVVWKPGGLRAELSAGIFAGSESSELGWYWQNSFVKLALGYVF